MTTVNTHGTITFMSSGEMSARMSPAHRSIMARLNEPLRAIFLDTPAGFQENATALAEKAVGYFKQNLQQELSIVSFKARRNATPDQIQSVADQILAANYIFSGPGSPTYAVRNWINMPIADAFATQLHNGRHLIFATQPPSPRAASSCRCMNSIKPGTIRIGWMALIYWGRMAWN